MNVILKFMKTITKETAQQFIAAISNDTDKGQLFKCNAITHFDKLKGVVKPLNNLKFQSNGSIFECLLDEHKNIKCTIVGYAKPLFRKLTEKEINRLAVEGKAKRLSVSDFELAAEKSKFPIEFTEFTYIPDTTQIHRVDGILKNGEARLRIWWSGCGLASIYNIRTPEFDLVLQPNQTS